MNYASLVGALPASLEGTTPAGPYSLKSRELFVPSAKSGTEWQYIQSSGANRGIIALVVATQLAEHQSIPSVIESMNSKNLTARDFLEIGYGTINETDYPFLIFRVYLPDAGFDVYYAHWGHKDATTLWSMLAVNIDLLEELVRSITTNVIRKHHCSG
jgi:hypothetical protein